jgi:hypothetical protein
MTWMHALRVGIVSMLCSAVPVGATTFTVSSAADTDDGACTHDGIRPDLNAVENLGARSQPCARANRDAG